jgi:hypothetical protein
MRTKNRADTWNATSNRYDYPQTPARVMLSLWPAGLQSNGQGTIDWAGGLINWNSPYMQNGYYYAMFSDVNVQCYNPPKTAGPVSGNKVYEYTDAAGTNDTVSTTNNLVVLKSLFASGDSPDVDPNAAASSAGTKPTATPESVPGVSGAGTRGDSPDGSGGSSGASSASAGTGSTSTGSGGFTQGTGSSGAIRVQEGTGSFFAVLVAVGVALCW